MTVAHDVLLFLHLVSVDGVVLSVIITIKG